MEGSDDEEPGEFVDGEDDEDVEKEARPADDDKVADDDVTVKALSLAAVLITNLRRSRALPPSCGSVSSSVVNVDADIQVAIRGAASRPWTRDHRRKI